jgi:hypothetical protein
MAPPEPGGAGRKMQFAEEQSNPLEHPRNPRVIRAYYGKEFGGKDILTG